LAAGELVGAFAGGGVGEVDVREDVERAMEGEVGFAFCEVVGFGLQGAEFGFAGAIGIDVEGDGIGVVDFEGEGHDVVREVGLGGEDLDSGRGDLRNQVGCGGGALNTGDGFGEGEFLFGLERVDEGDFDLAGRDSGGWMLFFASSTPSR